MLMVVLHVGMMACAISYELKEHGYVHEEPSSATLPGTSKDDGKDDEDDMSTISAT